MRFYLDEHLSPQIGMIARSGAVDVVAATELGRRGRSDEDQLRFAALEGRAIVTCNYDDFDALTERFLRENLPHSGVLFVPSSIRTNDHAGIAAAIIAYERDHPDGMPPYMADYLRRPQV